MCAVFTPTQNKIWVHQHFGVDLPGEYPREVYPGYAAPIIVKSHRSERIACGLARFGLIPAWAKDTTIGRHTYNARTETVAEKPSYRNAWRKRHFAIALIEHFYEPSYETGKAVRWQIRTADKTPFGIASIWDQWTDGTTGEVVVSFSMLTINAAQHPVMRGFHKPEDEKRTPLVLAPEHYMKWLDATTEDAREKLRIDLMPELMAAPTM